MGYDTSSFEEEFSEKEKEMSISAFQTSKSSILFSTDGLRSFGCSQSDHSILGSELTIHLELGEEAELYEPSGDRTWSTFVENVFTIGWIALQSSKKKSFDDSLAVQSSGALFPELQTQLRGVLITPCENIPLPHRCEEGSFRFYNMIGITEDELKFAEVLFLNSPFELAEVQEVSERLTCPKRLNHYALWLVELAALQSRRQALRQNSAQAAS